MQNRKKNSNKGEMSGHGVDQFGLSQGIRGGKKELSVGCTVVCDAQFGLLDSFRRRIQIRKTVAYQHKCLDL